MTLKYGQGHWQSYRVKAVVWPLAMCVKCSVGRLWTKETKITIFNDPLSFGAPSPANPREYLHKPYTARNYIFVADSIMVALQIFEQFCPKAGDVNTLVAEPETDFNAKWPFKVLLETVPGLHFWR